MIYFVTPRRSKSNVDVFLETNGRGLVDRMRVMEYETLLTSAEAPPGTYVLAGIDQLDSPGRNRLTEVYEDLSSAPQVQFVNSPRGTLLRTELLATLHQRGFNVHRAVKATDSLRELRYPVFIREEQGHEGNLSSLLHTPTDVDRALALQVAQGLRLRDLRVIEFLDTADAEGYFRTYGAFIVGTEIIPMFMSYGRRWMLKQGGAEYGLAMLLEERRYVLENPHAEALRPIFQLANVEYGRIDYSLHNGKIETWEINLNPGMEWSDSDRYGVSEELWPSREPARQYFNQRFQAAFEALDTLGDSVPIAIRRSSGRREALRFLPGDPERDAQWRVLKWFLRPVKPVALRVLRTLAPLLLRLRRLLN